MTSLAVRIKTNNIIQAWLVLVLTICFGGALAGVNIFLSPKIEENKRNEINQKIPSLLLGEKQALELAQKNIQLTVIPEVVNVAKAGGQSKSYTVYRVSQGTAKQLGWVIKNNGQGYADRVELLFGLDPDLATFTGVFVLDQKETPGLGNKITFPEWRQQFVQKPTIEPLTVVKSGAQQANEIDAITGATISSRTVCNIINSAWNDLREPLTRQINK
jgi:H+/Na+-translocating ferredoxin:NAD+ oxidoreductase subunit G